ncbi:response regulator [Candidatus Peregrinibacteria bacterium]|nr:response regulator [Candidatus Peregrinibacteria bacterium]
MVNNTKKILIIEDTPAIAQAVTAGLEQFGFKIEVATDGDEGLKKIQENHYNLVILDLVMPKKTGFDVLNNLKSIGNKTPVYVYSNMLEDCTKEDVINAGALAYFDKSKISLERLIGEVKKFTEQ